MLLGAVALLLVATKEDPEPIVCATTGFRIAYEDDDVHNATIIDDTTLHSINLFLVIYTFNLQIKSILNVASQLFVRGQYDIYVNIYPCEKIKMKQQK
jgi:hypothetical protein